ncbi:MAG: lysophospholipid acyltransferase family protein [Myxococcales bacterium]
MEANTRLDKVNLAIFQWGSFAALTAGYGLVSCLGGPFTGGRVSKMCMRQWCEDSTRSLGLHVETRFRGLLREAGPSILVANHQSLLDILVLGSVLDIDYKWVAKRGLFLIPFLGWHLVLAGHLAVDRRRRDNFGTLSRRIGEVLGNGGSVLFFPEGTRSRTGELTRFRSGAFLMAVQHGVPVVPVVLEGTGALLRPGQYVVDQEAARKVVVEVLTPLRAETAGDLDATVAALRDRTYQAIAESLTGLQARSS